jgi:hypothetical protein
MKTLIITLISLAAGIALPSCEQLAGVKFGACYEDACVSVTMPPKSPAIEKSGK